MVYTTLKAVIITINLYSKYLNNISANRVKAIEVIEDLRYGRAFQHYENSRVEKNKIIALTEEERNKLYVPKGYMERLIAEQVNYCPNLDKLEWTAVSSINEQRINRMYKALKVNRWEEELLWEVYDNQISKGDHFFEIYFTSADEIPRLRSLDSKKMVEIMVDDYQRPLAYIYKQEVINTTLNIMSNTADILDNTRRTVTWVFEKGKTTILDPQNILKEEGKIIYMEDGKTPKIEPIVRPNPNGFEEDFFIVHIPSLKRQGETFSEIIASRIVDDSITADQIASDINYANRLCGSPVNMAIDLNLDRQNSSRSPGGFINWKSDNPDKPGTIIKMEITNDLKSMENELSRIEDDLYRKMYLIRPAIEMKLSSSDSSRVIQQIRLSLEKFITKLTHNISIAMKQYFNIVQKSYGYVRIYDFTLKVPNPIIQNSVFDRLLQWVQELRAGIKTLPDIWREAGLSESEIKQKLAEHDAIVYTANSDVKTVAGVESVALSANNLINDTKNFEDNLDDNFNGIGQ